MMALRLGHSGSMRPARQLLTLSVGTSLQTTCRQPVAAGLVCRSAAPACPPHHHAYHTSTHRHQYGTTPPPTSTPTQKLTAKQKCDPYELQGKPLSRAKIDELRVTVHRDWMVDVDVESSTTASTESTDSDSPLRSPLDLSVLSDLINDSSSTSTTAADSSKQQDANAPLYNATLVRVYDFTNIHPTVDFVSMSQFVQSLANVAINLNHRPLSYTVSCDSTAGVCVVLSTSALKGLSYNDFHVAMQLDAQYEHLRQQQLGGKQAKPQ